MKIIRLVVLFACAVTSICQAQITDQQLDAAVASVRDQVIAWRRDIHQYPELGNSETRTAGIIAEHLNTLGFEVRTAITHTGVLGILRGGLPGPVIALRADMDALPVMEQTDLPFSSRNPGIMHACGHDTHVAMLMGIAQVLADMRAELAGTVMFIFQPAEEGVAGEQLAGAALMLEEGVFNDLKPEAIFGMHSAAGIHTGVIQYRSGPFMAAADTFSIAVKGVQTHGARPWNGVDPVVAAAQIVLGLQPIVSRQINTTQLPAILTVATIKGGVLPNIIPDSVTLEGTLRTFDADMRDDIVARMTRTASNIAAASGATATLELKSPSYPVTINNPVLAARVLPSLQRVAGEQNVRLANLETASEDFSYFANEVPGFYFAVGVTPPDQDPATAAVNHSPFFLADENALAVGVRVMLSVAVDYLQGLP